MFDGGFGSGGTVPQSVTLTLVGAPSFSRWRADRQPVLCVCCAFADNAGCQQSVIFPTLTDSSWGRFNPYSTTRSMLESLWSVIFSVLSLNHC